MARTTSPPFDFKVLLDLFFRLPRRIQFVLVAVAAIGGLLYFSGAFRKAEHPVTPPGDSQFGETGELTPVSADVPGKREVFFCHWNVENLFDKNYQLAYPYNTQGRAGYITLGWRQK